MDDTHKSSETSRSEEYGTEVMCANWNPVVSVVVEPIGQVCREWLADISSSEVDGFLRQLYRCEGS